MRRLMTSNRRSIVRLGLATLTGLLAVFAAAATASATPGDASDAPFTTDQTLMGKSHSDCVKHVDKALFKHSFKINQEKHKAKATIQVRDKALCEGVQQAFTLVSYIAPSAAFSVPQFVYDQETVVLSGAGEASRGGDAVGAELQIDIPDCYTQVDFIFGGADAVINPLTDTSDRYGNRKVGSEGAPGNRSKPKQNSPQQAWFNGGTGTCQTTPTVQAVPHCDGTTTINLTNGKDATDTTYVIRGEGGYTKEITVARSNPVGQVVVPASAAKHVTVSVGGTVIKTVDWQRPEDCAKATVTKTVDCTSASVTIANPAGNTAATASIVVEGSGTPQTVTVEAGASKTVPVALGKRVTVTVFGDTTMFDMAKPAGCASGVASASSTAPALPVTGANVAMIAGAAVLLLAAGAGLFLVARRRRVRFTA